MKKAKLIQAFSSFSKPDWISFRKYLLLKTGKDTEYYLLFAEIQKRKEALVENDVLSTIQTKTFKGKSDKLFSNMLSQLYAWTEEWLIQNQLYKDKYLPDLILLKSLNRRGLFNLADQTAKKLEKKILTSNRLDLNKSAALTELYHQQYYSDNPIKYKEGSQILNKLQSSYLSQIKEESLLYLCEFENWGRLKNIDYSSIIKTFSAIENICPGSKESELLDQLLHLIKKPEFDKLKALKQKLFIPIVDQHSDLHVILTMYLFAMAIQLLKQGKLDDKHLLFDLYEYGFTTRVLMNSGKIPELRFSNMVNILSNMQSEEETEKLILKWYPNVNTKNLEAIRDLALAQNKIYHNSFKGIIPLLMKQDFDYQEKIRALGMLAIAYFEEGDHEVLYNHLENLERNLRRNKDKFTKAFYLSYKNFVKILQIISGHKQMNKAINISDYPHLIFRSWIQEKLTE